MVAFDTWDQNLHELSLEERAKYEFNRDYATIISDVTSFPHVFLRELLESHWKTAMVSGAMGPRKLSEEEAFAALDAHNRMREDMLSQTETESKRIYLWKRGCVPSITDYTRNDGFMYADMPDFEPYLLEMLVDADTPVKGAVILSAGGAHMFRSNIEETYEVALEFNKLGYQCFIVNYRVNPYTDDESALDIARAIRYVRYNRERYRVPENRIAAAGFSWGGIVTSLTAAKYYGNITANALVESYQKDELDEIAADMNANLCIYSAVPEEIQNPQYPATFLCWGLEDDIVQKMGERSYFTLRSQNVKTEIHTFAGVPHGFGAGKHAGGNYYPTAASWIGFADAFMEAVFRKTEDAL